MTLHNQPDEFPRKLDDTLQKAVRLQWLSIAYLTSAIFFLYITLGSSQAMRAAWLEDILSLVPPIVFLIAYAVRNRKPTQLFPYGFHRVITIAFVIGAVALFSMGLFLVVDSGLKLWHQEHPTIGSVELFGRTIWLGWLMIPALLWTGIPAVFLGRAKQQPAVDLHDKVLYADADMNAADWKTAFAAILGILGIAIGWWWADSVVAIFIGVDILKDGVKHMRNSISDLINSTPETVDHGQYEPLLGKVQTALENMAGIAQVKIRFREEGHVFFGEAYVIINDDVQDVIQCLEDARRVVLDMDWRVYQFVIVPVRQLPDFPSLQD